MTLTRPVLGNRTLPRLFHSFALTGSSGLPGGYRSWNNPLSGQPSGPPDLRVSRAWTWQDSAQSLINYAYRLKALQETSPEDDAWSFWPGQLRPTGPQPVTPVVSHPVTPDYAIEAVSPVSFSPAAPPAEPDAAFDSGAAPVPASDAELLPQPAPFGDQFEPEAASGNRPADTGPASAISDLNRRVSPVRNAPDLTPQVRPVTGESQPERVSGEARSLQAPAREAVRLETSPVAANDFMAGWPGSTGLALLAGLLPEIAGESGRYGLTGPVAGNVESLFQPVLLGQAGSLLGPGPGNLPGLVGQGGLAGLQRMFRQLDFARREPLAHFNNLTGPASGNLSARPAVYAPLYQPMTSFIVRQNPVVSRMGIEESDFWDQPFGQLSGRVAAPAERPSPFPTPVPAFGAYAPGGQIEGASGVATLGQAAAPSPIEAAQETLVRLVSQAAFGGETDRGNIADVPLPGDWLAGGTQPLTTSLERLGQMLSGAAGSVNQSGLSGGLFPATRLAATFGSALANIPANFSQVYRQNPAAFANLEPAFPGLDRAGREPFRVGAALSNLIQAELPGNAGLFPANLAEPGVVSSPVDLYRAIAGLNVGEPGLPGRLTGFGNFNGPVVPASLAESPVQVYRQTVPSSVQSETGFTPGFYEPFQLTTGPAGFAREANTGGTEQPRNAERGLPGMTGRAIERSAATLPALTPLVAPGPGLFGLETAAATTNSALAGNNPAWVENSPTFTVRQTPLAPSEAEPAEVPFETDNEAALFPASPPAVRPTAAEAYRDWPVLRAIEPLTRETSGQAVLAPTTPEPFAVTVLRQRSPVQRQAAIAALHTLPGLGPGEGLAAEVRQPMETLVGRDLRTVRVYTSPVASELGVEAFTSGERVVFAPGRLDYRSHAGLALLGHELSHLGQPLGFKTSVATPGLDLEEQAALAQEAEIEQLIARGWPSAPQMDVRRAAQGLAMLVEAGGEVRGPQPDSGFVSGEYSPAFDGGNPAGPVASQAQPARPEAENLPAANLSEVMRSDSAAPPAAGPPDLKNIARQVYAILKGRLKAERDRRKMS